MNETSIAVQQTSLVTEDELRKFIVGSRTLSQVPKPQIDIAIGVLKAFNLNPFKREAHLIPYNGEIKIIVGYEVYLKRAEATQKLNGWKVEIEGQGPEMKAVVTIYRKDWAYPFVHEVYRSEVGQNTPTWSKMPRFMLKKVAIGQGFRLAFPEEIGGMPYTEGELPDVSIPSSSTPPPEVIEAERDPDVSEQPQEAVEDVTPTCEVCGKVLTQKAAEFSMGKYGRYQCITHSKNAPSQSAAVEPEVIDENTPATDEQKEKLREFMEQGKLDAKYSDKIEMARYLASKKLIEQLEAQG